MYSGFPAEFAAWLRCPRNCGPMSAPRGGEHVLEAQLFCAGCGHQFQVRSGIVETGVPALDPETDHEQAIRDEHARQWRNNPPEEDPLEPTEIDPTLRALRLFPACSVLELGPGTGRFTSRLHGCRVLAVDISRESLLTLSAKLPPSVRAGLVHADIATVGVTPGSFDRALSTLVSNLPGREVRLRMYQLAAQSLKQSGHFVFGTHYFGVRAKMGGETRLGRYQEGGIFREYQTSREVRQEAGRYFRQVRCRPIRVYPPLAAKLGLPLLPAARLLGAFPLTRLLGSLLLGVARNPSL
jgi:SAM-dependent methyltransferase